MHISTHYRRDKGPTILAVMWSTTSLAALFVIARIYTKIRILKVSGIDDAIIVGSMLIGFIFVGLTTASIDAGNGRHVQELTQNQYERAKMLDTAGFAPGILSFVLPKLGVVVLLLRILNPSRQMRIFLWTFMSASSIFITGCIIIIFAQCYPPRALWASDVEGARCWNPWILVNYSISAGALSAFLDIFLAVYPSVVLWRLQMRRKKKLSLMVIFCFGSCAAIVSIVKCTHIPSLADNIDFTYSTADLVVWTNVESNTIIIAACIPTLAPLIDLVMKRDRSRQGQDIETGASSFQLQSNDRWTAPKQQFDCYSASCQAVGPIHLQSTLGAEDVIRRSDEIIVKFEPSSR